MCVCGGGVAAVGAACAVFVIVAIAVHPEVAVSGGVAAVATKAVAVRFAS